MGITVGFVLFITTGLSYPLDDCLRVPVCNETCGRISEKIGGGQDDLLKEFFKLEINFTDIIREEVKKHTEFARNRASFNMSSVNVFFEEQSEICVVTIYGINTIFYIQVLQRAVSEILDNAVKYSFLGQNVKISLRREGYFYILKIQDQGIGITEEEIAHVGKYGWRSERAKAYREGYGEGLSLAKQTIETIFNGQLSIESPGINKGTTVTIRIPIVIDNLPEMETKNNNTDSSL